MEKEKQPSKETNENTKTLEQLRNELEASKLENRLTVELAGSGASDLETASLVAKARLKASGSDNIAEVVREVKKEKPFLFAGSSSGAFQRMQPAKAQKPKNEEVIKAAKKAAKNATRQNVFEYMKARRGWEVEVKK